MVVILSLSSLGAFQVIMWTSGKKTGVDLEFLEGRDVGQSVKDNFFLLSSNSFLLEIFPDMVPRD